MNPITALSLFTAKVLTAAFAASFVITRFAEDLFPPFVVRYALPICFVAFFALAALDQLYIYPTYRSPLRTLPSIHDPRNRSAVVMESPRGSTPLKWMLEHPTAEIIKVDGIFGMPILVLSGASSLRDVLNTRPYDFEKSWGVRSFLARVIGWGLILSEGQDHRKQRKALTPSFNIRNIRGLYPFMWEKTGILLEELQKDIDAHPAGGDSKAGKVEIAEWASRLTLDIIGPTAMGRDFQSLTHEDNKIAAAFLDILDPRPERLAFFGLHFIFPEWILRRLPLQVNKMMDENCGFLRDTCNQIVKEKKQEMLRNEKNSEFDILSNIMATGQFNDTEVVDQMLTFLAAGHETTASALTWACYLCARHPHIQDKLRAEIRERIPASNSPVTHEVLESMPYLNGVCEETQRLYPTVPGTIREAIVDTVVADTPVPTGTRFLIVPYAINRHPKFWGSTGMDFVPDRWIDTAPDGSQRPNKHGGTSTNFAEITFLHGPRACIGRDFAKAELRCAVAGLLGKFQIELQDPNHHPLEMGVITVKPAGGMHILLKPLGGW